MCNACGFYCCAWDGFEKCGCEHCPNPECWDDDEDEECDDFDCCDEYEEPEEMVFDCGVEGCLMPGEHFRWECHTAEDIEAMYAEHESSPPSI